MLPKTNLPWWRHDRPWGFRFSVMDLLIFLGGVALTAGMWQAFGYFALVVPYLLGHFFLFCNTFRVGGERTLIWVAAFLANAWLWVHSQHLVLHLVVQELVTLALIVQCVLGKNYHGLACQRINPDRYRAGALSEGSFTRKILVKLRIPQRWIEVLVGRRLDEFQQDV